MVPMMLLGQDGIEKTKKEQKKINKGKSHGNKTYISTI